MSGQWPDEERVLDGVYFRPGRRQADSAGGAGSAAAALGEIPIEVTHPALLEEEQKALEVSIRKLEQSNVEMAEYDPQGNDADIRAALAENEAVLERKRSRLAAVTRQLARVTPCAAPSKAG